MASTITIAAIVLIALLYSVLGKKLGKSPIAWAFVGIGVIVTIQLIGLPFMMLLSSPDSALFFWTMVHISSWVIAIVIAFIIARRNKLNLLNFKTKSA